jgi:predicted flap endonuclease-1-like 5' DNA nuclease
MNTAQTRTLYPYWFTTKLIPAKVLGFLTYAIYAIFNVWNFFFYSPARFVNNDIYYWGYAITGLVLSSLILALVVYVKKERRFISSRVRSSKVDDVIIQDVSAKDYTGVTVTTAKKLDEIKDDLKNVEGIGTKIEELLNNAGITTFRELAVANTLDLKNILEQAGARFKMHNPESWAMQAGLARDGKWSELKELQDRIVGGQLN